MSTQRPKILEFEQGHRKGVVLGLTLAELLILLLFCFLLMAVAVFQETTDKIAELEDQNSTAAANVQDNLALSDENLALSDEKESLKLERAELRAENSKLRELMPDSVAIKGSPVPDKRWRELVLASDAIQTAKENGIGVRQLVEAAKREIESPDKNRPSQPKTPAGQNKWPPIIILGNDEYRFDVNSAALSPRFRVRLQSTVAELRKLLDEYDVNVIEVVGHTDEQAIHSTQESTLDEMAIGVLNGDVPIEGLRAVDNAGLGLARAIAVATELSAADFGDGVRIIPLSAAQLVMPGDVVSSGGNAEDNRDRRRIEIRVRESNAGGPP